MTRFVTYDQEVAARLSKAVGVHRVELRDAKVISRNINPALFDAIRSPRRTAVFMPASDEQVLLVQIADTLRADEAEQSKKRKKDKKQSEQEIHEIGSRPSGFLGLEDEPIFSDEEEDPPRSLWKKDE